MDYCQNIISIYIKSCNKEYVGKNDLSTHIFGTDANLIMKVEELNISLDKNCLMSIDLLNKYCYKI